MQIDVYTPLQALLKDVWTLWELTLCGDPLLVVAPSPKECSGAVAALISLISPLPYAADFRPYYTIHDSDFKLLCNGQLPGAASSTSLPTLLGVTNLYFIKALPHWPHVLAVGQREGAAAG